MGKKDEKMNKSSLRLHTTVTEDIKRLITESQNRVVTKVKSELTMLYCKIGKRINQELLQNQRADYGKQILSTLSTELRTEFGQGFSERNLYRMVKFNNFFSDDTILPTLSAKLSWSHIVELLSIDVTLSVLKCGEECGNSPSFDKLPSSPAAAGFAETGRMTRAGSCRSFSITWDGTDANHKPVPSGVYLYQLKSRGHVLGMNKCLLVK
jgi:hypothetical protein